MDVDAECVKCIDRTINHLKRINKTPDKRIIRTIYYCNHWYTRRRENEKTYDHTEAIKMQYKSVETINGREKKIDVEGVWFKIPCRRS